MNLGRGTCCECGNICYGVCDVCHHQVCDMCQTAHDRRLHLPQFDRQEPDLEEPDLMDLNDQRVQEETYDTIRDALYLILLRECPLRAKYILDSLDDAVGNNLFG